MSKNPAFLFYPNDYIGGTMGMTFEEKGAYMELLMLQFNRGHMTTHIIGQTVGQLWDNIKDKFTQDEHGKWYNKRLEVEVEKRKNFVKTRYNNVSGVNQYTKKKEKKGGHVTSHMENENENINENIKDSKGYGERKERKGEKEKNIPTLDEFMEYALENKPNSNTEQLKLKYKAWVESGWMCGKPLRKIYNWKTTLLHTLPYIQESVGNGFEPTDQEKRKSAF